MFVQSRKFLGPMACALLVSCAAALSIVPAKVSAEDFERVTSEAAYRKLVVGKKNVFGNDWYQVKGNGRIVGMRGGTKYRANWAWRDGFLCRTELTHRKDTDCQLIEVSDTQMRITRKRGRGESFVVPK